MFQLKLSAQLLMLPTGAVARVMDLTDWNQAVSPRGTWALFLAGAQLGSIQAQDADLVPASYEPHTFQSGANPAGTVDVPLSADGVFRLQAVAVPVVLSQQEFALVTAGRIYWRLDTQQFVYKTPTGSTTLTSWDDVLDAAGTDNGDGADTQNLLEKSAVSYVLNDAALQAGLAQLNLRYLEAGNRQRTGLQHQYSQAALLVSGAGRQLALGLYVDSATTLTAASRLLGACLPGFGQSMPALGQDDCGCHTS